MPTNYKFSIRVATIVLALTALMAAAFAQSPEKPKKPKQSGWIGVMIVSVTEESNNENAPKSDEGALIESVVKKSPADSAGLKQEDVVIAFGGTPIKEAAFEGCQLHFAGNEDHDHGHAQGRKENARHRRRKIEGCGDENSYPWV
jgi:C-terminal processing protease CtpA/Prc